MPEPIDNTDIIVTSPTEHHVTLKLQLAPGSKTPRLWREWSPVRGTKVVSTRQLRNEHDVDLRVRLTAVDPANIVEGQPPKTSTDAAPEPLRNPLRWGWKTDKDFSVELEIEATLKLRPLQISIDAPKPDGTQAIHVLDGAQELAFGTIEVRYNVASTWGPV